MKTVRHKGKIYEIGKYYWFSKDGYSILAELVDIDDYHDYPIIDAQGKQWSAITSVPPNTIEIGTVTDFMVHGNAYMFDYNGDEFQGVYNEYSGRFIQSDGFFPVIDCKNIRRMIAEE